MATTYNDIIKRRPGRAAYSIEEEKEGVLTETVEVPVDIEKEEE